VGSRAVLDAMVLSGGIWTKITSKTEMDDDKEMNLKKMSLVM
jgi:hypothetical protein